jgi:hypothetical protein
LGDGIAGQFAEERGHASDPELDINTVIPDINSLDEEFDDTGLLGGEESIPERLECQQRTADLGFGYASRSWRSRHLLRSLWVLGGSFGTNPEVRDHGEIADGLSDTVTVPCHCKQAGRDHDARCIRVRIYAGKPQPDFGAAARSASASRSHHG